jgi:hypothetical protein
MTPRVVYLLVLDAARGSIVRYRKQPGLWKPERMQEAHLDAEWWPQAGSMPCWRLLETFRLTGRAE